MKAQTLRYLKEKWNSIVYFVFLALTILFLFIIAQNSQAIKFAPVKTKDFSKAWTYEYPDGTTGLVCIPAKLPQTDSSYLTLRKRLPQDLDKSSYFMIESNHCFVRISVDGEVLVDYITPEEQENRWFSYDGINFVEAVITPEYAGKVLTVDLFCSETKYLRDLSGVYLGDRGTMLLELFTDRIGTFIGFVILLMTAITLFVIWICAFYVLKQNRPELLCLAFFTFNISLWVFTESRLAQGLGMNTRVLNALAYEDLMLMPVPISLFFYYVSERERGKRRARLAASIPLAVFFVNNMLSMCHIVPLTKTLIFTQAMLGVELLMIAYIQVTELQQSHTHSEKYSTLMGQIPMVGAFILMPLLVLEIARYASRNADHTKDGILITLGVIIYIFSLGLDSVVRISYISAKTEQNSEMKTAFLANMSHEIRTPLNAILGFNDAIQQNAEDAVKVAGYSRSIQEAGENLKDIINSILDISKIEMGQLTIDAKEYNSVQLLDNLCSMFEMLAKNKGLDFFADIDPAVPLVMIGDEPHLRQVLTNILSNAVKYTDMGSVTLSVYVVEQDADSPMTKLRFSVKDTGRGIREEDRERLFAKFERLDTKHFEHTEGTGLGMSIVLYTLRAMGSEIKFTSVYGEGTTFYFDLDQVALNKDPMGIFAERREENANKEVKSIEFRAPGATVLLVDDVEMNLDAAMAMLEFTQMKMEKAMSGAMAIEMIKETRYDMIFMDHMMPGMDGIETTEKIRQLAVEMEDAYYAMVPIVALTANVMVGSQEMYMQAGMQDYVKKPLEMRAIISVLRKWLPKELVENAGPDDLLPEKTVQKADWELNIEGIEVDLAKRFNVDPDGLKKNMRAFVKAAENTKLEIQSCYTMKDLTGYVIRVHGLKSTSKMVGARALYTVAKAIEEKGHQGEMTAEDYKELILLYDKTVKALEVYFAKEEPQQEKQDLSGDEFGDILSRIKEAADGFDAVAFMTLEEELETMSVTGQKAEDFEKLKVMIASLSFGDVSEYIREMENR